MELTSIKWMKRKKKALPEEKARMKIEDEEYSSNINRYKTKTKAYLQQFYIAAYIKQRLNSDRKIKHELKDALNAVYVYAKNTIEAYDKSMTEVNKKTTGLKN